MLRCSVPRCFVFGSGGVFNSFPGVSSKCQGGQCGTGGAQKPASGAGNGGANTSDFMNRIATANGTMPNFLKGFQSGGGMKDVFNSGMKSWGNGGGGGGGCDNSGGGGSPFGSFFDKALEWCSTSHAHDIARRNGVDLRNIKFENLNDGGVRVVVDAPNATAQQIEDLGKQVMEECPVARYRKTQVADPAKQMKWERLPDRYDR